MATTKGDLYEILGVPRDASDEEIRRAFRRLARQYHPDVNKGDGAEQRFKEINAAYEILSDPEKRQRYDAFGLAGVDVGAGVGFSGGFGAFTDLFETFFGTDLRRRTGPARGSDLRMDLEIDFLQAVFGGDTKIEVAREQLCSRCGGSGAEPGTRSRRCDRCDGAGEVRAVQNTIFGRVMSAVPCPRCNGEGRVHDQHCSRCRGSGREQAARTLTVTLPAGIDDGQQLRLSGEGEAGHRGGPPGDLYVQVRVRPHPVFKRHANDIVYELRVSPALAALGGSVEIPTVDGPQTIDVPAGTQHASLLRVRGKGVPRLGSSGRGDEVVVVNIVVPTRLSANERKLWEQLRATTPEPDRAAAEKGLFDHLKDVFRG